MACFAKLFHKNQGFNPTQSGELPKVPDKSRKSETGRYIAKPEGSIKFLRTDDDIVPDQNHQNFTHNNCTPSQNLSINSNTNTILNNKQNTINTNTIISTSGTNINNNNSNNILTKNQNHTPKITTHLNSNHNFQDDEEKPQEKKIPKPNTKITNNNNKVISTQITKTGLISSSESTNATTKNEEIDNNETVSKTFINSKQKQQQQQQSSKSMINSIPSKENLISQPKDNVTTTIQTNKKNKEKLLRNQASSSSSSATTITTVELNSNITSVSSPVDVNPKLKESKKDKQKTLHRPGTTQPLPSSNQTSPNPYEKTGKSIEKLQKKIMLEMASSGYSDSTKLTKNNLLLKKPIEENSISVVNLPILGAHIIGNKDYEDRRHNRIQQQYGISTKVIAPLYLEELKQKQQEQHKQVEDGNCNWKDEKQNQRNELTDNNNSRDYKELTEKNLTLKNARCNPTGLTLITNFTDASNESIVDCSITTTIVADIEHENLKKLSLDSDDIEYCGDKLKDDTNDHQNLKINNGFVDDDENLEDKINDLAKLSDTINEFDNNEETRTEDNTNRKEGIFIRRPPVALVENVTVHKKDEITSKLIMKAIENNDFLNNYMDDERKKLVIDAMEPAFYDKGKFIIRENEEGSEIFVSDDGIFDVIKNNEIINTLGSGIVFGELAILYNAKRFASIRAATKAKVWKIDRTKFRTIMKITGSKEREENLEFLKTAPLLRDLRDEILLKVVDLLVRRFFPSNTCIIRQKDVGDDFYIIRGGTVTVTKTNELGEEHKVNRLKRGDYFGEQALLNSDFRQASVYSDAPGTECLKLDRVNFISYLGTIPELKEIPVDRELVPEINPTILNTPYDNVELRDLKRITTLGAGAFGRVDLVTYHEKKSFALKVIRKIDVVKQGQSDHIYNEKLVMSMCHRSPFIVELYKTFRDSKYVYFLMEACLGGDIWTLMYQRKTFDEKTARFISGCVIEAFDFLHSRNIIYRDLKPENLMLTTEGYCKLVDFGFAKRLSPNYKTNTFAGTPEYVAPEIILDRGHDRAADYWTLGVLIYELFVGRTPFRGKDQMKIYQNILGGINVIKMPPKIPKSAQNLIKHLCRQLPVERLGYQRKGIMDIKKHSWYDGFDWNRLQNQTMSSPIKRPVNSITDTQYFPTKFDIDTSDVPPDEFSGWDINF